MPRTFAFWGLVATFGPNHSPCKKRSRPDKGVTFRIKELLGGAEHFVFYEDISGIEIDNGVIFATIKVIPRARQEIVIENFGKDDAKRIKELILERVVRK